MAERQPSVKQLQNKLTRLTEQQKKDRQAIKDRAVAIKETRTKLKEIQSK